MRPNHQYYVYFRSEKPIDVQILTKIPTWRTWTYCGMMFPAIVCTSVKGEVHPNKCHSKNEGLNNMKEHG